jgi:hypothetical protein
MGRDEFFSHVTAAVIWGIPVPLTLLAGPIDASVLAPGRLSRAKGVRGHQLRDASTTIAIDPRTGLVLTDPSTTWATLGSVLRDLRDLVAAGDAVVRDWRVETPLASVDDLSRVIRSGRRVGIGRLRDAIPQIRTRSGSRPETRVRLELVSAGLPEPELNFDVMQGGEKLACVDLAYPMARVALEYEGEHHLTDPGQWAQDIARYERLAAAGWTVIRVTKAEVFSTPRLLVARVRRALAEST